MVRKTDHLYYLVNYYKNNLKKGYPKETLRQALINQGHSRVSIDRAIALADAELANEAPKLKTIPEIKTEVIEPQAEEKKSFWQRLFG